MTDHDAIAARVRQNRETGTPGPWKIGKNNPARVSREGRYIANFDPLHSNDPKCEDDARRAARLPDLEAAYLDLYDEVKRLRAERDRFEAALGRACQVGGTTYLVERAEKAEAERVAEWNRRREAEASRDLEKAVCATIKAERDRLLAALDDIAAAAFWIANEIHIGPEDEGRDIYDMALAIRDDASAAMKGPEE